MKMSTPTHTHTKGAIKVETESRKIKFNAMTTMPNTAHEAIRTGMTKRYCVCTVHWQGNEGK